MPKTFYTNTCAYATPDEPTGFKLVPSNTCEYPNVDFTDDAAVEALFQELADAYIAEQAANAGLTFNWSTGEFE